MIEVKKIQKIYGNFKALDDVSFSIKKGEVVGFLGPNGAGKTTTMKILTCYMPPSSGDAKIAGFDIFDQGLEVRKKIGYLPESAPLYTDMEVRDYLAFIARMRGLKGDNLRKKYAKVVELCNLQEKVKMPIATLSKGYKQRVGLAQALIHEPEILILDEPTSGLDPNQIIDIRRLIKEIGKEKTVLLSTHILPEVSATCGRVIIINRGKIVAEGEPEKLISSAEGAEVITVKISGPKTNIEKALKKIDDVSQIEIVEGENKDLHTFRVSGEKHPKTDLRKQIFDTVVKGKWSLYEMKIDSMSLEDVFINLTNVEETEISSNN
jgi:ABC-2 type transport system ATP-binding protein